MFVTSVFSRVVGIVFGVCPKEIETRAAKMYSIFQTNEKQQFNTAVYIGNQGISR